MPLPLTAVALMVVVVVMAAVLAAALLVEGVGGAEKKHCRKVHLIRLG